MDMDMELRSGVSWDDALHLRRAPRRRRGRRGRPACTPIDDALHMRWVGAAGADGGWAQSRASTISLKCKNHLLWFGFVRLW